MLRVFLVRSAHNMLSTVNSLTKCFSLFNPKPSEIGPIDGLNTLLGLLGLGKIFLFKLKVCSPYSSCF